MKHRMTVRAHRAQILDRVQLVIWSQLRDRNDVVHMDEPRSQRAVSLLEP